LSGYYHYFALALFVVEAMPFYLQLGYSLSLLGVLLTPWYLSFYIWRKRYRLLVQDNPKTDSSSF
jgi:hypothetical protein